MAQPAPVPSQKLGSAAGEVSLVRGGPFYHAQEKARLIKPGRWNLGRRMLFLIAIGWLPLVVLTALFHPETLLSLLKGYDVYARVVIAAPVLLAGQMLMESRFRMVVQHVRDAKLLGADDLVVMDRFIATLARWSDSWLPELLIIVLAYVNTAALWQTRMAEHWAWGVVGTGAAAHITPAGWYYALLSQMIYRFLLGLSLWKWLLWTFYMFRLSRLDLKLVPTHPDHHGGIGFLGLSPMGFSAIAFAICAAIGANWRNQILHSGANLMSFKIEAPVLLAILLIVALGPLVFFVPKLARLRRAGIMQYGILAQIHSTDFHEKWIVHRAGHEEEFLAAPEASTLTDYGASYENIEAMQPFPLDKGGLASLVVAIVVPMIPVILAQIPLAEVLKDLLEAVR